MPKVAKFVSLLVVVTAIAFYGHALTQQTRNITWPSLDAASGATLLFSACMLGILGVIGGGVWHVILIDAGLRPKLKDSMSIVLLSSIAKYVPGNVAHHLGKVLLAKEKGWPAPIVIQTMFAENLWNAATAVGFSVFGVVAFLGSSAESALALNSPHLFLPVVFVALWAMPWILSRALSLLPQSISNRFFAGGEPHLPSGRTALIAGCGYGAGFLILGSVLKIHALIFFDTAEGGLLEFSCLFAVAWVAGLLTPGAPGGMGVREALMYLLFAPVVGDAVSAGLALTLRIATVAGDVLGFFCGNLLSRTSEK